MIPFIFLSATYIFQEASVVLGFHMVFQVAFMLVVPPHSPFFTFLFHPHRFNPPILFFLYIYVILHPISSFLGVPPPLVPYQVLNSVVIWNVTHIQSLKSNIRIQRKQIFIFWSLNYLPQNVPPQIYPFTCKLYFFGCIIVHCNCTTFFISHLSVDGHKDSFKFLAITWMNMDKRGLNNEQQ